MDLDTFFVSCERLIDSRLNNRPVLIGGTSDRGVVASCSYEARKFGIHSSMPMRMAKQLCPEAVILRGNSGIYSKYSKLVTEIIKSEVPVYEKTSVDEFYLDLTGMDRIFGCHKFTSELRTKIIRESGLPISFGLSINKTVSKIATGEAKPNNEINVLLGTEKSFLAPLSVKKIPMIGAKTYRTLCDLGVKKIHSIQDMPVELMANVFGKNGIVMWKKANGIDLTPVIQHNERKSISTERTFNKDTIDIVKLRSILSAMAENLAYQLRRGDKLTGCVAVKVRYSDFQTQTLQKKIPYTAADHELIPMILELFERAFNRRLLVRLIGVRYSALVSGNYQLGLFTDAVDYPSLYNALDRIRSKYGDRSVIKAIGMEAKTIGGWNPFNGEPPALLANRRS